MVRALSVYCDAAECRHTSLTTSEASAAPANTDAYHRLGRGTRYDVAQRPLLSPTTVRLRNPRPQPACDRSVAGQVINRHASDVAGGALGTPSAPTRVMASSRVADGLPLPLPPPPPTLIGKVRAWASALWQDAAYVRGLALMSLGQFGDGLVFAASLMVLGATGLANPLAEAPIIVGLVTLLEQWIAAVGNIVAGAERDECKAAERCMGQQPPDFIGRFLSRHVERVIASTIVDVMCNVALLGVGLGAMYCGIGAWPIVLVLSAMKIAQVVSRKFRICAWEGLKYHRNKAGELAGRRSLSSTIGSIEATLGLVAYGMGSLSVVALAVFLGPTLLVPLTFGAIAAGTLVACLGKFGVAFDASRADALQSLRRTDRSRIKHPTITTTNAAAPA